MLAKISGVIGVALLATAFLGSLQDSLGTGW